MRSGCRREDDCGEQDDGGCAHTTMVRVRPAGR
jgi:hypothetical protein